MKPKMGYEILYNKTKILISGETPDGKREGETNISVLPKVSLTQRRVLGEIEVVGNCLKGFHRVII